MDSKRFRKGHIPWNKGKKTGKSSWNKGIPMREERNKLSKSLKGKTSWSKGKKLPNMSGENHPMFGKKHSEDSIRKMSEAHKGKMIGEKNPFYGKTHSEETRKKISETHKGKPSPMKGKKTGKPAWNRGISPSEKSRKKMSESQRKVHSNPEIIRKMVETRMARGSYKHTDEQKRKISLANKGRKVSEETRKKISLVQKKVWSNPEFKEKMRKVWTGRKHSEKTKVGHSEYMKKYWKTHKHPMIGKKLSKETIEKTRLANLGRIPWNKGKKLPELSEWGRQNILKQYESNSFPRQTHTKIEKAIKEELIKRGYVEGIDFIHQYKFMNKFMCDFCFPDKKVIVEADGDFWHCNPLKYPDGPTHPHQVKGIRKDKSKKAYITKVDNGSWTLLNFWESDIIKDVSKCVDEIEMH